MVKEAHLQDSRLPGQHLEQCIVASFEALHAPAQKTRSRLFGYLSGDDQRINEITDESRKMICAGVHAQRDTKSVPSR
jgi:hypothetical protein